MYRIWFMICMTNLVAYTIQCKRFNNIMYILYKIITQKKQKHKITIKIIIK